MLTTGTKLTKVARPNWLLSDGTSGLPPVASRDWFAAIPATVRAAARRLLAESSHRGREGVIAFAVRTAGAARVLSHEPDRQHGTAAHYAYGDQALVRFGRGRLLDDEGSYVKCKPLWSEGRSGVNASTGNR